MRPRVWGARLQKARTVNDRFDVARAALASPAYATAWERAGGGPVLLCPAAGPGAAIPGDTTRDISPPSENGYVAVYPSGLVLDARDIQQVWEYRSEVRYGTAREAIRYCKALRIPLSDVRAVSADRLSGITVRYDGARPDGRDYYGVTARPFPDWCREAVRL